MNNNNNNDFIANNYPRLVPSKQGGYMYFDPEIYITSKNINIIPVKDKEGKISIKDSTIQIDFLTEKETIEYLLANYKEDNYEFKTKPDTRVILIAKLMDYKVKDIEGIDRKIKDLYNILSMSLDVNIESPLHLEKSFSDLDEYIYRAIKTGDINTHPIIKDIMEHSMYLENYYNLVLSKLSDEQLKDCNYLENVYRPKGVNLPAMKLYLDNFRPKTKTDFSTMIGFLVSRMFKELSTFDEEQKAFIKELYDIAIKSRLLESIIKFYKYKEKNKRFYKTSRIR